jgi:hypothetical protein
VRNAEKLLAQAEKDREEREAGANGIRMASFWRELFLPLPDSQTLELGF